MKRFPIRCLQRGAVFRTAWRSRMRFGISYGMIAYKDDLALYKESSMFPKRNLGRAAHEIYRRSVRPSTSARLYDGLSVTNLGDDIFKGNESQRQFGTAVIRERFAADYAGSGRCRRCWLQSWTCPAMRKCCGQKEVRNVWIIWRNLNSRFMNMKLPAGKKYIGHTGPCCFVY